MRGTGSHDLVLEDVFVREAQVTGRRTWGELDHLILVTALHAFPVIYATYLGVAEGALNEVVQMLKRGVTEREATTLYLTEIIKRGGEPSPSAITVGDHTGLGRMWPSSVTTRMTVSESRP